MAGGLEMVRVRVLFLEPGNKIHPSWLDNAITDVMLLSSKTRTIDGWGEYEEAGYFKLCKEEFTDGLLHSRYDNERGQSPNDPCVEIVKPMVAVYFDLLENNSDWESGSGQIGEAIENLGLFDVFHEHVEKFIAYARQLIDRKSTHKSEYGTKVQFLTMWFCHSYQSFVGEWNSSEDLIGVFSQNNVKVTPMREAIKSIENPIKTNIFDPV
jgi:hypothetical protein